MRAAQALLAVLDRDADENVRLDGALLVVAAFDDLSEIRRVFWRREDEE